MMQVPVDREKFFNEANVAVLATTGPGQRPHAMPMWSLLARIHRRTGMDGVRTAEGVRELQAR